MLAGASALASMLLPLSTGDAAVNSPATSLKSLEAQAEALFNEVNSLSQQADGLRIQLAQARSEATIAQHAYGHDLTQVVADRIVVGQLAAQSYMNGGLGSTLEVLTTSSPQTLIKRGAILQEVQQQNGDKLTQVQEAATAAERAQETARQETQRASQLTAQIAAKQREADAKAKVLDSSVYAKAMSTFEQTGHYPKINLPAPDTIGAEALHYALGEIGKPYVWGGAGPNDFDCSGLVMWAYAQVGISLPHFTGDQWNSGIHVSRPDLQPGDLVFFFADISHVGMYIGNGLMVDAPTVGQNVQVQPVMWDVFVGAVRIV